MKKFLRVLGPLTLAIAPLVLGGCAVGTGVDVVCEEDADCADGACLDGVCVAATFCSTDFDCPVGTFCVDRVCQSFGNNEPNNEPNNDPNNDPGDDCEVDGDCRDDQHCEGGVCAAGCHTDEGCMVGQVCDVARHVCEAARCQGDDECPEGRVCDPETGACVSPPVVCGDQTCEEGQWCDYFAAACIFALPGPPCTSDAGCAEGQACTPSNDADEALVTVCVDRVGQEEAGASCEDDGACASGLCLLGVCFGACAQDDDCTLDGAQCRTVPVTPLPGHSFSVAACLQIAPCTRDADCVEGEVCGIVPVGDGLLAICVEREGDSPAGAACAEGAECASGVCVGDTYRRCLGACASEDDCAPANADCVEETFLIDDAGTPDDPNDDVTSTHQVCDWSQGTGAACGRDGACVQEVCTLAFEDDVFGGACRPAWGAAGPGAPCEDHNDCRTGLCLDGGVCYGACLADNDCTQGTTCEGVTIGEEPGAQAIQICVAPPPACASDLDCAEGLFCLPVEDPNTPNQIITACVQGPGGAGRAGQSCTVDADCGSDFCLNTPSGTRVCYGVCEVGPNRGCNGDTICYPNSVFLTFDQDTVPADDDRYDSTSACQPDFGSFGACANDSGCPSGEICYPTANRFRNAFELRCFNAFNPGGRGRGGSCTTDAQCASDFCIDAGSSDFCFTICANSADCDGLLFCDPADLTVNDRGTPSELDDITDTVNVCQ